MVPKKKIWNMGYIAALTGLLLLLAYTAYKLSEPQERIPITIRITGSAVTEEIRPWYNGADDTWYFFLPSYANAENAVLCAQKSGCQLGNKPLDGQEGFGEFEAGVPYHFAQHGFFSDLNAKIVFLQSSDVSSVYIKTSAGNMDYVHKNKSHKEAVGLEIYDESGKLEYRGRGGDKIRGHGNSTWEYEKKPYNLYLSTPADLTGGGESTEFVLLANWIDLSELRNTLLYELANRVSGQWNPHIRYVDLYIDGVYSGLYALTDKIGVSDSKVVMAEDDILMNLELTQRAKKYAVLDVAPDISAEIIHPRDLQKEQIDALGAMVHHIFDGIQSGSFDEQEFQRHIDLESWAWLYLLQELSANYDSGRCSLYFYLRDEKLFAGPAWDYDNTFGIQGKYDPKSFLAKEQGIWKGFFQFPVFEEAVKRIYRESFREQARAVFTDYSKAVNEQIEKAVAADELRWKSERNGESADSSKELLMDYYSKRMEFLDRAWLENIPYYTVTTEMKDRLALHFSIEAGNCLASHEDFLARYDKDLIWLNESDNTSFNPELPVNQDYVIVAQSGESSESSSEDENKHNQAKRLSEHKKSLRLWGLCSAFVLMGSLLVYADVRNNGRRDADGAA